MSVSKKGRLSITTFLTVVSKVANNLSSAKTSDLANWFINVDFPALVYPIKATLIKCFLALRLVIDCFSIFLSCFLSSEILSLIILLSVSICVSPGPRIPIPPFCRSKCVHILVSLGSKYWYWASSTCVLACAVLALLAKISSIRLLLSNIFDFSLKIFSIFLICVGDKSSSKIITETSFDLAKEYTSSIFPFPKKVFLSGLESFCINFFIGLAPAVFAKKASSSRYSFVCSSDDSNVTRPTNTAFSIKN